MDVLCTIEARMGSSRLPGKVLKDLAGAPMLARIVDRVRNARRVDRIVIATTVDPRDDVVAAFAERIGVGCFRGSEDDVLGRIAGAVRAHAPRVLVALTGDNPFVDAALVDHVIDRLDAAGCDYATTTHMQHSDLWPAERSFPRGISVQAMRADALLAVDAEVADMAVREHSTIAIYDRADGRFKLCDVQADGPYAGCSAPDLRLTVDTPEDFARAEAIFRALGPDAGLADIVAMARRLA